jgi:hypothetical protein
MMVSPSSHAQALTSGFPPDPTSDIPWNAGYLGVEDIQTAFNNARTQENAQLGIELPMLTLPSQAAWDVLTDGQRALWLMNEERAARGMLRLQDVEVNVTSVAQDYAQFLLEEDKWGHNENGLSPSQRMQLNPVIQACYDFTSNLENLAVFATSGSSIPLPVERSVYLWMYFDSGSSWGHRHAVLSYFFNNNSGPTGAEGFLGIGRASGGPYKGPFEESWPFVELIVMDVFDPCADWDYGYPVMDNWVFLPMMKK